MGIRLFFISILSSRGHFLWVAGDGIFLFCVYGCFRNLTRFYSLSVRSSYCYKFLLSWRWFLTLACYGKFLFSGFCDGLAFCGGSGLLALDGAWAASMWQQFIYVGAVALAHRGGGVCWRFNRWCMCALASGLFAFVDMHVQMGVLPLCTSAYLQNPGTFPPLAPTPYCFGILQSCLAGGFSSQFGVTCSILKLYGGAVGV